MIDTLNKVLETIGRPFEMIITNILKMGEKRMTPKQSIIVTNGEYKDRIFQAVIGGKDVAFVEVGDTIESIPAGSYELFTAKGGIPEAFDTDGTMYVPPKWGEVGPEAVVPLPSIQETVKNLWAPDVIKMANTPLIDRMKEDLEARGMIKPVGNLFGVTVTPAMEKALAEAGAEIMKEAKNRTPIGYLEDWPNPGHPDDVENNVDHVDKMDAVANAIKFHPNDEMANLKELQKADALIKALRERSAKKAESNVRLSNRNDLLEKTVKEMDRDIEGMIQDNKRLKESNNAKDEKVARGEDTVIKQLKRIQALETELKEVHALNKHHIDEIEKGNQYRAGIKRTVEELHGQLDAKNKALGEMAKRAGEAEAELDRYKRIVDHITKKPSF
jgi:hypothetical protein